jgi:uncharacterized protein YkwD
MPSSSRHIAVRTLTTAAAAAVLSAGLAVATTTPASAAPKDCNYMGYLSGPDRLGLKLDTAERSVFNMINGLRGQNKLTILKESSQLARPAMWASLDDFNRKKAPPDHIDSRGMGPFDRAKFCGNYTGNWIGEINYEGHFGGGPLNNAAATPEAAFRWWLNSPPHKANMLDPKWTTMMVGRAYNGVNATEAYWTVDFGVA